MDLATFRTGSLLHFACLVACGLIVFGMVRIAKRRDSPEFRRRLQGFIAIGCLAGWLVNATLMMWPDRFDWRTSLPLHFCNLANLIAAVAVLSRSRFPKAVLYFWAIVLCSWAFITPVLSKGPVRIEFWIFWGYHLFIPLAVAEILAVQRFRPNWLDFRNAWLFTIGFIAILVALDNGLGWDYGFVGPSIPENPTLLGFLGPYPLRLLWMLLIGTALYALLMLPFRVKSNGEV